MSPHKEMFQTQALLVLGAFLQQVLVWARVMTVASPLVMWAM